MMMKNILSIGMGCLIVASLLFSCQNSKEPVDPVNPNGESEMAVLMRAMRDSLKHNRIRYNESKALLKFPGRFQDLPDTEPTDVKMLPDAFPILASAQTSSFIAFNEALTREEQMERHNTAVENCLSCHAQACPGPVPSIRKLRIK
jgi:hypothetical protein